MKFTNLNDFLNYTEFCPLCNSRTVFKVDGTEHSLSGQELAITQSLFTIRLNILSNVRIDWQGYPMTSNGKDMSTGTKLKINFGNHCAKYHFFFSGSAMIDDNKVDDIECDKYYFIRILDSTHFAVNNYIKDNVTNIRITTPNFNSFTVITKLIDFDFSSKKKIDTKLKNIQLLG